MEHFFGPPFTSMDMGTYRAAGQPKMVLEEKSTFDKICRAMAFLSSVFFMTGGNTESLTVTWVST